MWTISSFLCEMSQKCIIMCTWGHMLLKIDHGILSGTCHSSLWEVWVDVTHVRHAVPDPRVDASATARPTAPAPGPNICVNLLWWPHVHGMSPLISSLRWFHFHHCPFANTNHDALTSECQLLSTINTQFNSLPHSFNKHWLSNIHRHARVGVHTGE